MSGCRATALRRLSLAFPLAAGLRARLLRGPLMQVFNNGLGQGRTTGAEGSGETARENQGRDKTGLSLPFPFISKREGTEGCGVGGVETDKERRHRTPGGPSRWFPRASAPKPIRLALGARKRNPAGSF